MLRQVVLKDPIFQKRCNRYVYGIAKRNLLCVGKKCRAGLVMRECANRHLLRVQVAATCIYVPPGQRTDTIKF